ncbi:MAG: transposase [Acidobacteria bacterium]|nr:transposase [Acidobacteriota bacterium]
MALRPARLSWRHRPGTGWEGHRHQRRGGHAHFLASMPPALALEELVRVLKSNFSRWVKREKGARGFAWQTGYAAYSVSHSSAAAVAKYILEQEEYHRHILFQEEYLEFLKKNKIEYDERFIWG